jgi:hypothetical protein
MSSLSLSGINIVSWIIGSGLIVFTTSTIYTDFIKRPEIRFEITNFSRNSSSISVEIWVSNFGMIPANDITLAIETFDLKINGLYPHYYEEDIRSIVSNEENPNKAVTKIPRLSSLGNGFYQNITLTIPKNNFDFFDNNTDIDILASYEEGNNLAYYYVIESGVERYSAFSDIDVLLGYLSSYYIIIVLPRTHRIPCNFCHHTLVTIRSTNGKDHDLFCKVCAIAYDFDDESIRHKTIPSTPHGENEPVTTLRLPGESNP